MAELLKDQYYLWSFYEKLGRALQEHLSGFKSDQLLAEVKRQKLVDQDLKTKMYASARLMHQFLPDSFQKQIDIVVRLGPVFDGLEGMALPAWVELYGLEHPETSVKALEQLTRHSSSEFAIRPFIIQNQEQVLAEMLKWADDPNEHVRRLASEGCRPRLPWAMACLLYTSPSPRDA